MENPIFGMSLCSGVRLCFYACVGNEKTIQEKGFPLGVVCLCVCVISPPPRLFFCLLSEGMHWVELGLRAGVISFNLTFSRWPRALCILYINAFIFTENPSLSPTDTHMDAVIHWSRNTEGRGKRGE